MTLDREAAFMHEAMVRGTERDQVIETRFAAVGPMPYVVRIEVAFVVTTRERAATIARVQGALQHRRHRALFATDVEDVAVGVMNDRHDSTVAAQPVHGRQREIRFAAPTTQCRFFDVNHH